jgi:hypothetical protein
MCLPKKASCLSKLRRKAGAIPSPQADLFDANVTTPMATAGNSSGRSHELDPQWAPDDNGRLLEGRERDVMVLRVEQPIDLRAAGLH